MELFDLPIMLIAGLGAVTQEIAHWYELRTKLAHDRYAQMLRSPGYWIVTVLMVTASSVGVNFMYGDAQGTKGTLFILGAAFPLIFKKLMSASASDHTNLGARHRDSGAISSYFRL